MISPQKTISDMDKVARRWLHGKLLTDVAATHYGNTITLVFRAMDAEVTDYTDVRLVVHERWSVTDKQDPDVLANLTEKLKRELEKPKYLMECVQHAPDILRLYLLLGVLQVRGVTIDQEANLRMQMSDDIEIYIEGHSEEVTDQDAWTMVLEASEGHRVICAGGIEGEFSVNGNWKPEDVNEVR